MIIDAHLHLWKKQDGLVDGRKVIPLKNGRSDFGGEIRQMMPPYMIDGVNSAETLISNMDYAGVSACAVTQEEIDGNQDDYLLEVKKKYPERFRVCSLYREDMPYTLEGFDGIKLCAGRLKTQDLTKNFEVFRKAAEAGKYVSIDLADGDAQTGAMKEIISELPDLRIAIGHFGMVTREGWKEQIRLARNKNVFIESGGITWLFNSEFYPFPSAVKAIKEAAEICGIEKLMWGSDYPRTMAAITYKMSFDFVVKSKELSEREKELFLGANAEGFYGFKNLTVPEKIKNMVED